MRLTLKDIPALIENREDFTVYSYSAENIDGTYSLYHWDTQIAAIGPDSRLTYFNAAWYSATTNRYQSTIYRALGDADRALVDRHTDFNSYPARNRSGRLTVTPLAD